MGEKEALHSKLTAYVPTPPLGEIIPDVERLVEIGDASSIEPNLIIRHRHGLYGYPVKSS